MIKIFAILILMVLINAFMLLAVKKAGVSADKTLRKYFLDAVGTKEDFYSALEIEEQKEQDSKIEENLKETEKYDNKSITNVYSNSSALLTEGKPVNYKNIDFKREYQMVKEKMVIEKKDLIKEVINHEVIITDKVFGKIVATMCSRFNFETIYKISTLPSDMQLMLVREMLLSDEKEILEDYLLNEEVTEFDCIDFFNYIKQLSYSADPNYYVRTGWQSDNFDNIANNVITQYDRSICEGIKILHQQRIYDYSI